MKNTKLLFIFIITTLGFQSCFNDIDDNLSLADDINPNELIEKDSDLYNLFIRVTNHENDPLQDIVCIEFVYSLIVTTYDEDLIAIDQTSISNNAQFYNFLDALSATESISISFPIEATLSDGTNISINTNEELKNAIGACANEDIIGYMNSTFESASCVWKVPFLEGENNTYAGGFFRTWSVSNVTFKIRDSIYDGTWTFFFIENNLNFNINMEGTSQVAQDWNINFNVAFESETLKLTSNVHNYHLKFTCEFVGVLEVGQEIPEGGIIAYDKEFYSNGWRYIEVETTDLISEEWGCLSGDISLAEYQEMGYGYMNSAAVANYHQELANYENNPAVCNQDNDGSVAASTALIYEHNLETGNKDWCLPTIGDLFILYENLHQEGLGNFQNAVYWSSTQSSESVAKALDFTTGEVIEIPKNSNGIKTRVIRYF